MAALRRLEQLQGILTPTEKPLLVLPDDSKVFVQQLASGSSRIFLDGRHLLDYRSLEEQTRLVTSAIGTPHEKENPTPSYQLIELSPPAVSSSQDLWVVVYVLWTLYHSQEYIPITIPTPELPEYILLSGLGRKALDPKVPHIFLVRAAFWQGGGQGPVWNNTERSWLRSPYIAQAASFPSTQSFTRTPLVIAAHPLRAPKPPPGTCLYRRYCTPVQKMVSLHTIDPSSERDMDTFHRWMNDELVNKGWGEKGSMEKHRKYVDDMWKEPSVLPVMMSWDGELMGYCEFVWIRENHVATYIPEGPLDYDRGLHLLVGEAKFRGAFFGDAWFRSATHFLFLADARTLRIIGEPKSSNAAVIRLSIDGGMHLQTSFHFPYKHSVMTMNLRERFFKQDLLT